MKKLTILSEFKESINATWDSANAVYFSSTTCGPCKTLGPLMDVIADKNSEFPITFWKCIIDSPESPIGVDTAFNLRSVPTLLFFKGGKEQKRLIGLKSEVDIQAEINKLIEDDF